MKTATLIFAAAALLVPTLAHADCFARHKRDIGVYQAAYRAGQQAARRGNRAQACRLLGRGLAALQRFEAALANPACRSGTDVKALADVRRMIEGTRGAIGQCGSNPLQNMRTETPRDAGAGAAL